VVASDRAGRRRNRAPLHALDSALFIAGQDVYMPDRGAVNLWPLSVAFRELRQALDAFQRREPPPEAEFPIVRKMFALVHPDGRTVGLQAVTDYLAERGVM
jgi:hypothetical protein